MSGQDPEEDTLIEEAASAFRPERLGKISSHPAWHDLSDEGRKAAFSRAQLNRTLEAALDPQGLNQTIHAVLQRIRRAK